MPTLKYYLREGLLMPGRATSRTRAEYGPEHLERLRLVRALVEHGGVGIAGVRSVLGALAAPPPSRHDFLGVAHCALPTSGDDAPPRRRSPRCSSSWAGRSGRRHRQRVPSAWPWPRHARPASRSTRRG